MGDNGRATPDTVPSSPPLPNNNNYLPSDTLLSSPVRSSHRKERRMPSVTPRRLGRFFTPRSSLPSAQSLPGRRILGTLDEAAVNRQWQSDVDLSSDPRSLGRLASQIALVLMGKHKPIYDPSTDCGDYVVAVGCKDVHVTGKKMQQKKYYRHTTRPGSLKEITMEKMKDKWGGGELLRRAVRGMTAASEEGASRWTPGWASCLSGRD